MSPHKNVTVALAGVAQVVGVSSPNQKAVGSIPGQGIYVGCGFGPGLGAYDPQCGCLRCLVQVHMEGFSLAPMFLSLLSSLQKRKSNRKCPQVRTF